MATTSNLAFELTEQGVLPDRLVRRGIQRLLNQRLLEIACQLTIARQFIRLLLDLALKLLVIMQHPVRHESEVAGQVQLLSRRLAVIVTTNTVLVKHGLHFGGVAE